MAILDRDSTSPSKTKVMELQPLIWSQNCISSLLKCAKDGGDSKAHLPSGGHTGAHLSAYALEARGPCREGAEVGFSGAVTVALCRGSEAVPSTSSSPPPHQALKPSTGQDHTSHPGSGLFLGPAQYHRLPFWPPLGQSLAIFPWQRPLCPGPPRFQNNL